MLPSEPTAWLRVVWAFSHSQGNSWEQEPCMGIVTELGRGQTIVLLAGFYYYLQQAAW